MGDRDEERQGSGRVLSVEGYIAPRRFGDCVIAETTLERLRLNLRGVLVTWEGRPVGRIEEVEIDDKGLRVKAKLFKEFEKVWERLELQFKMAVK